MTRFAWFTALLLAVALAACGGRKSAPPSGQQGFANAEAASAALAQAVKNNDQNALAQIFGPSGKALIASGDAAQDQDNRQQFTDKYQQMHRLATSADGTVTLFIGAENWPFPIPLVKRGSQWEFDAADGAKEVLYRRIGRNEAAAIEVCQQLIAAQHDYYARMHQYAQHFVSDPGKRDGLFWSSGASVTANPTADSPIGPLLAFASLEGAAKAKRTPTPFHGYYYRMVKGQGPGSYAFVAYPALYRSSGVMTFWVNQAGTVYQDDLGPDSAASAKAMTNMQPDAGWQKAN